MLYVSKSETLMHNMILSVPVLVLLMAKTPATLWTKVYGGQGMDNCSAIIETADGGFVITGDSRSSESEDWHILLIKINDKGRKIWSKTYGSNPDNHSRSVKQTMDGGYIVAGFTKFQGNGHTQHVCAEDQSQWRYTLDKNLQRWYQWLCGL